MDKKSVSATILILFLTLFFAVIGICFSTFVFKYTKVIVSSVKVNGSNQIKIYEDRDCTKQVVELKLSSMDTGLRPATGEIDSETQIPSTITNTGTSEGYYSTVYVTASGAFNIVINDIQIKTSHDKIEVSEQRKNIFLAVKDVNNSVKTLEENGTVLASYSNLNEPQEITFLIWLGSLASDVLEGADISFSLDFVAA